jgi:endoglucanase
MIDWKIRMKYTATIKSTSFRTFLAIMPLLISISSAEASPRIEFLGCAAPDVIEVVIQTGRVNVGRQVPYVKQDGDVVKEQGRNRYLYRSRNKIGVVIGKDGNILRPFDTMTEEPMDIKWAGDKAGFAIVSATDANYRSRLNPLRVHRKSRPTGIARTDDWRFKTPVEHHLYLVLPHPLQAGAKYEISFASERLPKTEFTFQPLMMRSEAVHVSHIGFHPDDPAKVAFLSCWMGNGGGLKYPDGMTFHVVDNKTGTIVHSGKTLLSKPASEKNEDAYKRNFNLADVYEMDFTGLNKPGRYRVCVSPA